MKNSFIAAISVFIGTCIGAGVLGIPYVASKAGFPLVLLYIIFLGATVLLLNLYLGEISLRTKGIHQLPGYAEKYLGKNAGKIMKYAAIFGIYAAIVAYLVGVGQSLSFLIFGNLSYSVYFGILFGLFMSVIIKKGIKSLKKYEKFGVGIVLALVTVIFCVFVDKVNMNNLNYINFNSFFLPFGVVLFALLSFFAVPEIAMVLKNDRKEMKKVLFIGSLISIIVYALFAFVVAGFKGSLTPEVATLALGGVFIFLGMFTMFTAYLSLGNALEQTFQFDEKYKKFSSWFFSAIIPVLIYVLVSFTNLFSFIKILSIGGVVSGGIIAILILFMVKKAKLNGERKPEYKIPINWFLIFVITLVFVAGILREVFAIIMNFN